MTATTHHHHHHYTSLFHPSSTLFQRILVSVVIPYFLGWLLSPHILPEDYFYHHLLGFVQSQTSSSLYSRRADTTSSSSTTTTTTSGPGDLHAASSSSSDSSSEPSSASYRHGYPSVSPIKGLKFLGRCDENLQSILSPELLSSITFALHRNGEADPCARITSLTIQQAIDVLDKFTYCPADFDKFDVDSFLTELFVTTMSAKSSTSCMAKDIPNPPHSGFLGHCDRGFDRTPIQHDHEWLIPTPTAKSLPCHYHTREGVRITSLEQLATLAHRAQEDALHCKTTTTTTTKRSESSSSLLLSSTNSGGGDHKKIRLLVGNKNKNNKGSCSASPEVHLYTVPAGRFFMFAPKYIGEVFDMVHVPTSEGGGLLDDDDDDEITTDDKDKEDEENETNSSSSSSSSSSSDSSSSRSKKKRRRTTTSDTDDHEHQGHQSSASTRVQLRVLSVSPRVFDVIGFFSEAEADLIAKTAERQTAKTHRMRPPSTGVEHYNSMRTSDSGYDTHSTAALAVKKRAFSLLGFDEHVEGHADGLQVLRYNTTSAYMSHLDYMDDPQKELKHDYESVGKGGNRFVTILLYLSTCDKDHGGETVFPHAKYVPGINGNFSTATAITTNSNKKDKNNKASPSEQDALEEFRASPSGNILDPGSWEEKMVGTCRSKLAVRPVKARAVMFYNQNPNGSLDLMSLHGGCPVLQGTKWAANLWMWNTIRSGVAGGPQNEKEAIKAAQRNGQKKATFTNSLSDPSYNEAKLYFRNHDGEERFWENFGKDSPFLKINTFPGHEWIVKVGDKVVKHWTIGTELHYDFVL